jgi:cytochrome c peroxidase
MRRGLATAALIAAAFVCVAAGPRFDWRLPAGVAPPPVPADNPMSAAKVELGRRLFYDADLSVDGTLSCASCHEQHRAFAEGNPTRPGVRGVPGRRNVMGLANVAYLAPLTWADPAQTGLEAQVAVPVTGEHPIEMGMHGQEAEIARRLSGDACYRAMFAAAFPDTGGEVTFAAASKAIAAFERTLLSWNSPYDRHLRGDRRALAPEARRGEALFREKGCAACHAGPNFTDARFHAIAEPRGDDRGLAEKTGASEHQDQFRTPSLRNAELTGPYLHDGTARTLRVAIFSHDVAAQALSQDDATEIEAFLASLTDQDFVTDPRLALPTRFCGKARSG